MHLTIDARMYAASGIGTYLRNLIPKITAMRPDIEYTILGHKNILESSSWASAENVNIINFNLPIYSIKEQFGLKSTIPECDLFFSPHYNVPMLYSGKIIATIHDIYHLARENQDKTLAKHLYARLMISGALRKSKIVMTDSEFTLTEMCKYNLPHTAKVRIVYLGFGFDGERRQVQNTNTDTYILHVGNVKPHKNLKRLFEAYRLLHQQYDVRMPLKFVGEAEDFITGMPEFKRDISASSWGKWIEFTGWVNDSELMKQYENAALLIQPSLYEGFGLPPLEAMASGCPCVVSRAASLPEICGDAVLYCDPYNVEDIADKIFTLLTDDTLRSRIIARGFEHIKKFSWEKTAREFLDIAEEAVSES